MHARPLPFPLPLSHPLVRRTEYPPPHVGAPFPGPHPDMVSLSEPLWYGCVCGPWVVCSGWPTGGSQLLMQIVRGIPDTAEPEVTYAGH